MLTAPTLDKLHSPQARRHGARLDRAAAARRLTAPRLRRALRPARRRRVARPREQAPHPRPAGGQAEAPAGLPRGHRLPRPARARQGRHPPARHLPLGRRSTTTCPRHRRHRHRQELRRLRPRPPGLPQGLSARSTAAPRASSTSSPSPAPTAPTSACSRKLARVDVLLIDDWGLGPAPGPGAARSARDPRGSLRRPARPSSPASCRRPSGTTTSATPTLADAICDRLLHNAHRIVLKGPSRRKEAKLDD